MKELRIITNIVDSKKLDDYLWSWHVHYNGGIPEVRDKTRTTFYVNVSDAILDDFLKGLKTIGLSYYNVKFV